jgi:3-hydroxy-9,10-secoandrosta-1,3,5(10)-triene-9,17-dione monooxygenase
METANDPLGLLDTARALVPKLRERAARADADRAIPAETLAEYKSLGLYRVLQPRRFGGLQGSFGLFSAIGGALAMGCGASAWIYTVLGEHQWILACMPERAQIDVWGDDPAALASSSLAPRETAARADRGWRLTGDFPFSSGCLHASWAIIGARAPDAAGNAPVRYMLVPMSEIEIVDDWHVLGLRGTASRSLRIRDAFVPEYRTVLFDDLMAGTVPGAAIHPDFPLLRAPRGYLVPFSLPTVAFSLGLRALGMVPDAIRGRMSRGTRDLGASEVVQLTLGKAAAAIENADLIFRVRREESVARADAGLAVDPAHIVRNRRDVAHATELLTQGLRDLMEIRGSSAVYDRDPLQTVLRDATTIATHSVVHPHLSMIPYGRMLLGIADA